MASVALRLQRLERSDVGTGVNSCPDCGRMPNGRLPPNAVVNYKVMMDGWDQDDSMPEHCPACGARVIVKLEFDDRD